MITDYIPLYPERITGKELAVKMGIRNDYEVRIRVNKARRAGVPVLSDKHGYSIATDRKQISKCIQSLMGRVNAMNQAISGMVDAYTRWQFGDTHEN